MVIEETPFLFVVGKASLSVDASEIGLATRGDEFEFPEGIEVKCLDGERRAFEQEHYKRLEGCLVYVDYRSSAGVRLRVYND